MLVTHRVAIPQEVEEVGYRVIGCGQTVHRILGPGFKESIYQRAYCLELEEQGLRFECEKKILVPYKDHLIDGHRLDLIIEGVVIVKYVVGEDGSVRDAKVLKGPPELSEACLTAVRTWRFQPMVVDGAPIAFVKIARFPFRIR